MAIRSGCVAIQLGNSVTASPIAITSVGISAGVATVTATAVGVSHGDIVYISGSTGIAALNGFHMVRAGATNEALITNGNIVGSLGTVGTIQRMNTAWTTISEVATMTFEQAYNTSEAPSLDDCSGIIEKVATTVSGTGSMVLNWLPADVTQGMVSGLTKLANGRTEIWIRAQNNSYSETDPTYEGFKAIISNYARGFETGTHQQLTLGLELNTVILTME